MSKNSSQGTQTTTQEPPAYLRPYLQYGVGQASNLYGQGGPQQYPGNTVVPFSPATESALGRTEQRSLAGSPVTGAAQGYATDVLGGKYLNANPYVDEAFNRAALNTQNQISSQFGRAGRNEEAAIPGRSDQLNALANQFYYQNYANERQMQQGMVPFANQLANQDYTDIAQQANVGQTVEDLSGRLMQDQAGRWDFAQNAPGMNLDQYLSRLTGGYPGSSTSTPTYRNRAAGGLGGALAGAQLGSQIYPGWGTLIGAVGGGLLGGYG